MKAKQWWITLSAVSVVAAGTVGTALYLGAGHLDHAPAAETIAAPTAGMLPQTGGNMPDTAALAQQLQEAAENPELGAFSAVIRNATTQETLLNKDAQRPMLPASATKMLTATAALLERGPGDRIQTTITQPAPDTVRIHAAGDVWLNDAALSKAAEQITQNTSGTITTVEITNTAWSAPEFLDGWEDIDIDAGYIAPMQPAMINGARIGGATGDLPRSRTPLLDVAQQLAQKIGATTWKTTSENDDNTPIAAIESPPLSERIDAMMVHSDNVMAEAIGRELDPAQPVAATLRILQNHGLNTEGIQVLDNSGLSTDNRISVEFFADLMQLVVDQPAARNLVLALPVAGGTGTLADRYTDQAGEGWVRAKTGTLTGVSALVGLVPDNTGNLYTFALIANDADILSARAAMDQMLSKIRTQ